MNKKDDSPQWIRWHRLPPALAAALASGQSTIYLALHAYKDDLAILAVPVADRILLSHLETVTVTMTIVRRAPSCQPRPRSSRQASPSSEKVGARRR